MRSTIREAALPPFRKLLVANRGEIAVRIIRAARELGIGTVAVYSDVDAKAVHVEMADESVCIGPAPAGQSYLQMYSILSAASVTGADALHPGFGFLAENPRFAEMCAKVGVTFVGPRPETIALLGDKVNARACAKAAGVPVIPGTSEPLVDVSDAMAKARDMGYPVMLKAAAGGGGRGIRRIACEEDLASAFPLVLSEAKACFGDDTVYMEKCVEHARHVEVQVIADSHGNTVHLFERDCTIQRNNQKLIEEAPCAFIDEETRRALGDAAVRIARTAGYENAGTVEFLVNDEGFFFMEMNTRIQVEHPVTEMITGIDIVKTQIEVAAGEPLPFDQEDVIVSGHAIECRINAEDPATAFRPSPGQVVHLRVPGGKGVRWDSAVREGTVVPPHYDSMIGKLIVHGNDRAEAVTKMALALDALEIEGVHTTAGFLSGVVRSPVFSAGEFDTTYLGTLANAAVVDDCGAASDSEESH